MGCAQSRGDIPRPPHYLQKDPHQHDDLTVHLAKIQHHEDYGLWRNLLPTTYEQQKETIWLWFNRVHLPEEHKIQIDLENFRRGTIDDMPEKGRVLYNITIPETLPFEYLQRYANANEEAYAGLLKISSEEGADLNPNESDDFYVHHPIHRRKIQANISGKMLPECIITKWVSKLQIVLEDGTEGRNVAVFGEEAHPVLEVQIRGTIVTSYVEVPSFVKEIEHTIKKKESRYSISLPENEPIFQNSVEKLQTELVDVIEFRLLAPETAAATSGSPGVEEKSAVSGDKVLAEWAVRGDSYHHIENKELVFQTPLYNLTMPAGWLNLFDFQIQVKGSPLIDSAMVMILGYLHGAEFSVENVKKAVVIGTPDKPPSVIDKLVGEDPLIDDAAHNSRAYGLVADEVVGGGQATTYITPAREDDDYLLIKAASRSNEHDVPADDSLVMDNTTGAVNLEEAYCEGEGEVKE